MKTLPMLVRFVRAWRAERVRCGAMSSEVDLDALRRAVERARRAADELQAAGGVVGQADLANRWGISNAAVAVHTKRPDFPEPVAFVGTRPLWLAAEVDLYRHTPRKPGPRPGNGSES